MLTKDDYLVFRRKVLVDATYQPVDGVTNNRKRDAVIAQDYDLLRDDLEKMLPDKSVPIILVKVNVFRLLHRQLTADGFNVINGDIVVYFPASGRQGDFQHQFAAVLKSVS